MGLVTTAISGSGTSVSLTGSFLSSGYISSQVGFGNSSSIGVTTIFPENYNFVLYGPITINNGISLTIPSGSAVAIKAMSSA